MKVTELFEMVQGSPGQGGKARGAFYPPAAIRPTKKGNVHIRGSVPDWLDAMGVDAEAVQAAHAAVKKSDEYRQVLASGLKDVTSERDTKNGTLAFRGTSEDWNDYAKKKFSTTSKFKVLANGKIDIVADNDWHRHDLSVPKPRIVKSSPQKTVELTMRQSLKRLAEVFSTRVKRGAANIKKGEAQVK